VQEIILEPKGAMFSEDTILVDPVIPNELAGDISSVRVSVSGKVYEQGISTDQDASAYIDIPASVTGQH